VSSRGDPLGRPEANVPGMFTKPAYKSPLVKGGVGGQKRKVILLLTVYCSPLTYRGDHP
jgi:hypothetical protein